MPNAAHPGRTLFVNMPVADVERSKAQFAKLPIADPTTHTLALYCFSVSSRDEVDAVSAAALAAGGSEADDAEDYGFMYSRSFFDPDGHGWQVVWIDPTAAEQG